MSDSRTPVNGLEKLVVETISEYTADFVPNQVVHLDSSFVNLGMDSLDVAELMVELEDKLGRNFSRDSPGFHTVRGLLSFIKLDLASFDLVRDLLNTKIDSEEHAHAAGQEDPQKAFIVVKDYVDRTTHWNEGGATRHDALLALKTLEGSFKQTYLESEGTLRQELHRQFRELGYTTNRQTTELLNLVFSVMGTVPSTDTADSSKEASFYVNSKDLNDAKKDARKEGSTVVALSLEQDDHFSVGVYTNQAQEMVTDE